MEQEKIKIKCPFCGYIMPVAYTKGAQCSGVYLQCKGRGCKKVFELRITK